MYALSTEGLSKSAEDARQWAKGETLTDEERSAWEYLCSRAEPYPRGEFIPPFRAPDGPARTRGIVGARLDSVPSEREGYPTPAALWAIGEDFERRVVLDGSERDAFTFAESLLCTATRSKLIVFANGSKHDLRLIAQRWGLALDQLGYSVDMLVNGGNLRALIIKKGKHRWYLVDWASVTGRPATEINTYLPKTTTKAALDRNPAARVYLSTCYVQWFLRTHFSVGLGVTISATALRASARGLPVNVCKWRPLPLLSTLCRVGYAFRGGLVSGRRYRGNAILVDLNRAYTAALCQELPLRSALGKCVREGEERAGVFLCSIRGTGNRPVYCGRWNAERAEFELGWHNNKRGGSFVTVLPSAEFDGVRAAGFELTPGIGFVFTRTFTMRPYVEKITRVVRHFGPQSPEGKLTKLLGNAVYGKFAAAPERRTVRLSTKRPGLDWYVWVDSEGYPVENVWEQTRTSYQWSQHVDIASVVTARVRNWMLVGEALVEAYGGKVLGMQTDCLLLDRPPPPGMPMHSWQFGAWKLADQDEDGIVVGSNCYAIGQTMRAPDHPAPSRDDIVALFERESVDAWYMKRGTPRPGAPLYVRRMKTIRTPNRADPLASSQRSFR